MTYAERMSDISSRSSASSRGRVPRITPTRVLWAVLAIVAVILLLQNSVQTTLQFLGFEITAPLFVIIGGCLIIGWLLGEVGERVWRLRRRGDR